MEECGVGGLLVSVWVGGWEWKGLAEILCKSLGALRWATVCSK